MRRLLNAKRSDIVTALSLYLLNIFDMFATMFAITKGYAIEMNPIMKAVMDYGMGYFVFIKVVVMFCVTVSLLFLPLSRKINVVLLFVAGMYTMLGIMHILIFLSEHAH